MNLCFIARLFKVPESLYIKMTYLNFALDLENQTGDAIFDTFKTRKLVCIKKYR